MINGNSLPPIIEKDDLFSQVYHQLYQLQDILISAKNKIEEEHKNLQVLISDISHQVRTPITNLELLISSFQQYDLTISERNSFIEAMNVQIKKISELLISMIEISRLENGTISLQAVLCPLSQSLLTALKEIFPMIEKKEISVSYTCEKEYKCTHDPKWCKEAFFNILDNAVKYTPEKGSISISVTSLHAYVQIQISDTGIGIPPNEYSKIFQRFYRSPNVYDKEGVGLGLYLARNIITQQNGYITVDTNKDLGTTFKILLPK